MSSPSHGKRKTEISPDSENVAQKSKRSRTDAGPTLIAESTAQTTVPTARNSRKRTREPVDESTLRRSKRLRGEPPSPAGPLASIKSRNKGKGNKLRRASATLAVEYPLLHLAGGIPRPEKPVLRIETNVRHQVWTKSSRYPALLAERRHGSRLFVDTLAATKSPGAETSIVMFEKKVRREAEAARQAARLKRVRPPTPYPTNPPRSQTMSGTEPCSADSRTWLLPHHGWLASEQLSVADSSSRASGSSSAGQSSWVSEVAARSFVPSLVVTDHRDQGAETSEVQIHEDIDNGNYKGPHWPEHLPSFPNAIDKLQTQQESYLLKKRPFYLYLRPFDDTAAPIEEVLARRAVNRGADGRLPVDFTDDWENETFSEAGRVAEISLDDEDRELKLAETERRMWHQWRYVPPLGASIEERERSLFEAQVHYLEAMAAAKDGYNPLPTNIPAEETMHLLRSFQHESLVAHALFWDDTAARFRAGLDASQQGLSHRERYGIIVDGQITLAQRRYIAERPQGFSMMEKDVAIKSIEWQRYVERQRGLGEGSTLTDGEKRLRHNSGYREKAWERKWLRWPGFARIL